MLDLGEVPPDQSKHTVTEAKAASPLPGVAGSCSAVNQLSKSVVRQIRMLRSVGAGGGQLPPATRWDGKRSVAKWPKLPRPSSTLPFETCRPTPGMSVLRGGPEVIGRRPKRRDWTLSGHARGFPAFKALAQER